MGAHKPVKYLGHAGGQTPAGWRGEFYFDVLGHLYAVRDDFLDEDEIESIEKLSIDEAVQFFERKGEYIGRVVIDPQPSDEEFSKVRVIQDLEVFYIPKEEEG